MGNLLRAWVIAMAAVSLLVAGSASAKQTANETSLADLPPGEAAAARGDYETAFKEWSVLAAGGGAKTQYNLASLYYNGWGVEKNLEKALEWYQKAGHQGLAEAQRMAGAMHHGGEGTMQHYRRAVEWYRKAADQGDAVAQHNLSVLLFLGFGVAKGGSTGITNETMAEEAKTWQKLAVEAGIPDAQFNLGTYLNKGFYGFKQDREKALELFRLAAAQGQAGAEYSIGDYYYHGLIVEKDQEEAAKWFLKAALKGVPQAQLNLGVIMYGDGEKGSKEHMIAYFWADMVTESGNLSLMGQAKSLRDHIGKGLAEEQIAEAKSLAAKLRASIPPIMAKGYSN